MQKKIRNLSIHYQVFGKGEFLLVLHGWGAALASYQPMIDFLAQKYQVVWLDLPGFGLSDEPPKPWKVDDYTDLVIDFINALGAKSITLLGHSFGGRIIAKLLNRSNLPFVVPKIILFDSAGVKPKKSLLSYFKLLVVKTGKIFLKIPLLGDLFEDQIKFLFEHEASSDYLAASEVMRRTLSLVINEDLTKYIAQITLPSLLIWGENDDATPVQDGKLMATLISQAELHIIPQSGHYPFVDDWAAMQTILGSWLKIKSENKQ